MPLYGQVCVVQDHRAYTNSGISTFWSLKLGTLPRWFGSMGSSGSDKWNQCDRMEDAFVEADTWASTEQLLSSDASGVLQLGYCISECMQGNYTMVTKGSLAYRLAVLGVFGPSQPLSHAQACLRVIAYTQHEYFSEPTSWRMVGKDGEQRAWGPERPTCANGAFCFVNKRDAHEIQESFAAGRLKLLSKHIVISAEYVPILCRTMAVAMATQKARQRVDTEGTCNVAVQFRRAVLLSELTWYPVAGHPRVLTYAEIHQHYHAWKYHAWGDISPLLEKRIIRLDGQPPPAKPTVHDEPDVDDQVMHDAAVLINFMQAMYCQGLCKR